jgi:putative ABC transport system substrate-binding protein
MAPMRQRGWVEGENVTFERRYADGRPERLPAFAAELVGLKVDVIIALLNEAIHAARQATRSIPIVMVGAADPVGVGFVESLSRPGGNVTGVSVQSPEFGGKVLEVLKDAFPGAQRVALLWEPRFPAMTSYIDHAEKTATTLGVTLRSMPIMRPTDIDAALRMLGQWRPDALYVVPSGVIFAREREIVRFANDHAMPAIYTSRTSVEIGGLMSYSASLAEMFQRTAVFVDKILRGARPADLPVEQPTKFELVINLRTARAGQLAVPPAVLLRAEQLIE